ncbi:uncharacterized protein LOC129906025 [Episyrphus balteatus]|uniref:uncharacterized protein LOC129906025 n=1 Tax=Episyrphus balteatus TaxID=286459 RepID=UPI00248517E4|nr:uncharacterized protein LOC129906025 [Episyrphus balteatus]
MLSTQVIMEANSFNSIESYRYHIHNYSPLAVKSFISEIQKYPIIFSSKKVLTLRKELVEFAWTRITVALLDTVVPTHQKIALINLEYWNQSFRQLWKWMVDIYIKEQSQSRLKSAKILRFMRYQWLEFMSFLDPHIRHCGGLSYQQEIDSQINSNIRLEVLPAETKVIHLDPGNHIILWLRKFSESMNAKNMCISVCMEIQRCFSPPLPMGLEAMFKQDADIDESQLVKYVDSPNLYQQPQPQIRYLPSVIRKEKQAKRNSSQLVPFETVIDKDYQYIMSLYEKLVPLEPARKSKVKRLMILALIDAL